MISVRRQAQRLEPGEQRVAVARVHQRGRMETQKEPFVMTVECIEVAKVERLGQPAEFQQVAAARGLGEHLVRGDLPRMLVVRAQRGVIADRAPVRHGENRLKYAENGVAAVENGAPGALVAGHRAGRLKTGRIEFDHAHHVSRVGGGRIRGSMRKLHAQCVSLQDRRARSMRIRKAGGVRSWRASCRVSVNDAGTGMMYRTSLVRAAPRCGSKLVVLMLGLNVSKRPSAAWHRLSRRSDGAAL